MHSKFLRPASSTNRGEMVSDATSERARQLSVEKRWSQEAPVDGARSRRLSGTVYGLRILALPLPTENAPRAIVCRTGVFVAMPQPRHAT